MKSPWKCSCLNFIDDCGVRDVLNLHMAENVWSHYFEREHHPNLLGITAARLWVYVSSDQVSLPYPVWPLQLLRECVYLLTYIIISGRELIYYRSYSHGFTATNSQRIVHTHRHVFSLYFKIKKFQFHCGAMTVQKAEEKCSTKCPILYLNMFEFLILSSRLRKKLIFDL